MLYGMAYLARLQHVKEKNGNTPFNVFLIHLQARLPVIILAIGDSVGCAP